MNSVALDVQVIDFVDKKDADDICEKLNSEYIQILRLEREATKLY